jgi:hypothetical protein
MGHLASFSAFGALVLGAPAKAENAPICTDRPAKANAVCTVPAGKLQLESNVADWVRIDAGDAKADIWQVGGSVLKLGLTDHSDLQLGFTPYVDIDSGPNHLSGVGDVTLRYKHRLTGGDARVQVAVIPFIKLPTARHDIGNGKVEGGLAVPVSTALGKATLTFGPELDLLTDSDGDGRHPQLVNLINIAGSVAPKLTLAAELWTATNFDPADAVTQLSADAALAYLVTDNFQLDAGANLGLNRDTPDMELYAGFSIRF